MRIRWLPIALGVSLLANVGLAALILVQALDMGHYQTDQQTSWRWMTSERRELQAMRAHFCPDAQAPGRTAVLAWVESTRSSENLSAPYDKDGLLWLDYVGVKLDADGRVAGVCLPNAWALLDDAALVDEDRAGELCPLEPLC